jgi:hypothetical protein
MKIVTAINDDDEKVIRAVSNLYAILIPRPMTGILTDTACVEETRLVLKKLVKFVY